MTRRRFGGAVLACLAAVSTLLAPPASAAVRRTPPTLPFARHEVVVIADEGVVERAHDGRASSSDRQVNGLLARFGLERATGVGPHPRAGATRRERIWVLSSPRPDFDPVEAARALNATGSLRAACPNYRFAPLATLPDDIFIFYQWYVDDGGFADVRLPFAWDIGRGDSAVVIAIMDTGVDTMHPDLAGQIWRNPDEVAANGLDDDGNGLVDDVEGWDFGWGDSDPKPEYTPDASGIDVGFHGTMCAGIASAATNNGDGIAGAGWNCRIMPLKVSHPDSGFTASAIAGAFAYAADEGASIVSMSFGGPGDPGVPELFQGLVDMATAAGAVCIAAAGNDGDSVRVYPAACDNILAVGATDFTEARAEFSNWGPWVDLAAPGSTMWSSICTNYEFTLIDQLVYILLGWDTVNPYMYGDGTSFACPLTAGVCGLVRAQYPSLTPGQVAQHMIATGDAVAYDQPIGVKVNAFNALNTGPTAVAEDDRSPATAFVGAAPNPVVESGTVRFALPSAGPVRLVLYDVAGRRVRTLVEGTVGQGSHAAPWDGCDDRGARVPAGVYFARLESQGEMLQSKLVLLGR